MMTIATCYNGSGAVLNDIQVTYNTFSLVLNEYHDNSSTVIISTSPSIAYAYADGSANQIRPTTETYPNSRVFTYNYGTTGGGKRSTKPSRRY